jgi:hypothetical protein
MENTKTLNVISTPDITGNIGTCETRIVNVANGRTLWTETYISIATNNCTGTVNTYDTWQFTGFFGFMVALPVAILLVIAIGYGIGSEIKNESLY